MSDLVTIDFQQGVARLGGVVDGRLVRTTEDTGAMTAHRRPARDREPLTNNAMTTLPASASPLAHALASIAGAPNAERDDAQAAHMRKIAADALAAHLPDDGLSVQQEPKYTVNGSAIVTRATGKSIPRDVPVFLLRAEDPHAAETIAFYAGRISHGPKSHWSAVMGRIEDFLRFSSSHPERMKAHPDTDTVEASRG